MSAPLKWFVVLGRESGESEDRAEIYHATCNQVACMMFTRTVSREREAFTKACAARGFITDPDQKPPEIYIIHVINCGDERPMVEVPQEEPLQ